MSSGGFLDDTELLAFARPPATPQVTPVLQQYQRPTFDIAPIIDTANKFAMAKAQISDANQVKDFNAQANPLKIEALKTEVQNGLDQQSAAEQYKTLGKAQAADAAAQYVIAQPAGDEQTKAWNAAADTMVAHGMMTPDEAAKWKGVQPGQYQHYADGLHQTRGILENYMVSAGGKSSKGGMTASEDAQLMRSAHDQALAEKKVDAKVDVGKRTTEIYQQMSDQMTGRSAYTPPAAKPAPTADSGKPGWLQRNMAAADQRDLIPQAYNWLTGTKPAATGDADTAAKTPGGAPPASGVTKAAPPTAGAEAAAGKAGSAVADRNAARANMTAATGKSADDAIGYTGDPKDEVAQKAWFDALQPGQWFLNPKDGQPMQKAMGETLKQAEGG